MTLSLTQKVLIFGAVAILLVLGSVFLISAFVSRNNVSSTPVIQTQVAQQVSPETRLVAGTVEKISGQEITIKAGNVTANAVGGLTDKSGLAVVVVGQTTVFERIRQKDGATISRELHDFLEKMRAEKNQSVAVSIAPPDNFTRQPISLSDIKIGDNVSVVVAKGASKDATFTAIKLEVQDAVVSALISPVQ